MKRALGVIFGVVLATSVCVAIRLPQKKKRVDCHQALQGEYATLGKIDAEGYALPFAGVTLDEGSRWELVIDDVYLGAYRTQDRSRIVRLQRLRFECTDTDYGTPETGLRLYRNGVLVYSTDFVMGEGLQNEEFGFLQAENRLVFLWTLHPYLFKADSGPRVPGGS